MGRLDDAAKHKVVELRKAGLSFRKIKAVLELENIKVSAQAIYLFLREFQGRPPGRVRPVEARSSTTAEQVQARAGAIQESWNNIHLQNLLREASHHNGLTTAAEFAKHTSSNLESSAKPPGYGETSGGSRSQQHKGDTDENDIQIVSVTSLAQNSQQRGLQSNVTRAETGTVTSTLHAAGTSMRRRVTPSPATTAMLAARKRLLDKALSHRMKHSYQQVASLIRKDHASVQGSNLKSAVPQPPQTYNLTTEKTVMEGQPGGGGVPKRFLTQRPGLSVRSPHPPPRVGIRLPNQPPAPLTSSAPGAAIIRLQNTGGQCTTHSDGSPQQAGQNPGGRGGLQDQIQTLGTEVRSLGLAVKMLVEQQCRLEREHVQQTHVQKQILSTLQSLALKLGHCSSSQEQHNKTPSPSTLSTASTSTSFSQDGFNFNQGPYTQCSQTQPSYNSLDNIESVETFKLPALSPTSINGFPPCSNAESIPLTHTPPQRQPYAAAYTEQTSQTLMPPYTQSYVSSYGQSHSQSFRMSESKSSDFPSSCSVRTLQDCSVSTQLGMNSNHSAQDQQVNIIKVEGP
ncbi:hypothetical protein JOB18_044337 [Solea senegalensis]|uniref:Uncharacterized protein n=1 Tax=Solea senegalensis TaxID=28829 RepID=A0AAV6RN96_SOLSE|nr:uncharacterized protein LOC122784696 isoform X1 [Solea senegalensis]KAG7505984.1 hypothetical protein JOB18_044337 [Solea senegalensis]